MKKECPLCGKSFDKSRMVSHIKKAHKGWKGIKEANQKLIKVSPKDRGRLSTTSCPYCKKVIPEAHIKIHMEEWHAKEYERDHPLTPRQALKKAVSPDKKPYSEDFLDSNLVYNGGGFGVGRGKK
ncbi:MAG: hypothetical protein V7735_18480 [Photobacterium frigidiphilum]|uniref:hypothetical protein n=1 Tax=Photobacterium frigidiphilum TaxID=264736 RepID=UPI0030015469